MKGLRAGDTPTGRKEVGKLSRSLTSFNR
jgi:hypothetical protein